MFAIKNRTFIPIRNPKFRDEKVFVFVSDSI